MTAVKCYPSAPFDTCAITFDKEGTKPNDVVALTFSFTLLTPLKVGQKVDLSLAGTHVCMYVRMYVCIHMYI